MDFFAALNPVRAEAALKIFRTQNTGNAAAALLQDINFRSCTYAVNVIKPGKSTVMRTRMMHRSAQNTDATAA